MARFRCEFWLDGNKDDELLLLETIDELKQKRSYSSVIRDGIRLIVDLRAGRIDVLLALFPWIESKIKKSGKGDSDLERRLDELQRLIMAQGGIPAPPPDYPVMKPVGSPKPLNLPKASLPRFDDDEAGETIVLKKGKDSGAGLNFINAALSLQQ